MSGHASACLAEIARRMTLACALLVACDPPEYDSVPHPTEITFEGEFIDAGAEDGVLVCAGSFEHVDRFVGAYLASSANPAPLGRVRYHAVSESTFRDETPCPEGAAGCAGFGVVYSRSPAHLHEVVHAIRQRQRSDSPPGMKIFEEGIAQLYAGRPLGWSDEFEISDMLEYADRNPPGGLYDRAGHLLAFVQGTGRTTAEAFVDASAGVDDAAALSALVQEQVGMDLPTLEASYAAYPRCSSPAWAELPVECAATPLVWMPDADGPGSIARLFLNDFRCSNPAVIGPLRDRIWTSATVDVQARGLYELSREGVDERVSLVACNRGCGDDVDVRVDAPNPDAIVDLMPGRYVIRVEASTDAVGEVGVALRGPL